MASAKHPRQRRQSGGEEVQPARNLVEFSGDRPRSHEPSSKLMVAISQELGCRRNRRDLTGVKLADPSGVSAGMATRIENRDVAPSIQTLVRLADALEVPTSMSFHRLNRRPSANVVPEGKGLVSDRSGTRRRA